MKEQRRILFMTCIKGQIEFPLEIEMIQVIDEGFDRLRHEQNQMLSRAKIASCERVGGICPPECPFRLIQGMETFSQFLETAEATGLIDPPASS